MDTRRLMVVDVEATCYEPNVWPEGQEQEIIEVGAVVMDSRTAEISECKWALAVQPDCGPSGISSFCTDLTSLTWQSLAGCPRFAEACYVIANAWDARRYVFASWGDFDRKLFERECARKNVEYPWGVRHLNLKLAAACALGWKRELSIAKSLEALGLEFSGAPHRAQVDAYNAARVWQEVLRLTKIGCSAADFVKAPWRPRR